MAPVNYAEMYQEALQQKYSEGLAFSALYSTPNNANIKWVGAKTIHIPNITTGGFQDVDRDIMGDTTRRVDNAWIPKTLEHDRKYKTLVDPMDIDETKMALSIANITRVFNNEHKIPEMDKYMASKLFTEYESLGEEVDTTEITEATALSVFDDMMEQLDEAEVPQEGRILYVRPAVKKVLKNAESIQKQREVSGTSGAINRNVRSLDEVTIVTVPTSRMKTLYNFADGAVPAANARDINMILIHPSAVISPQKYENVSIAEPSAITDGKSVYFERKYWDVFIIEQKVAGVQINVTAVSESGE
ncbi:main capsid protein Gp34-like protein [Bacillus sp. JCM 19046]|nr:main capsid protein Gp34-like protein [Bacillus sp. JCM 19045]GAF18906.1 main capsid protein Gp34-like protein [Bacillus sp. JCM 19046]